MDADVPGWRDTGISEQRGRGTSPGSTDADHSRGSAVRGNRHNVDATRIREAAVDVLKIEDQVLEEKEEKN